MKSDGTLVCKTESGFVLFLEEDIAAIEATVRVTTVDETHGSGTHRNGIVAHPVFCWSMTRGVLTTFAGARDNAVVCTYYNGFWPDSS